MKINSVKMLMLPLVVMIISFHLVDGNFVKSRTWHEDLVRISEEDVAKGIHVLYPSYKTCIAPREKPEQVKKTSFHKTTVVSPLAAEGTWSSLISVFATHSGQEIYSWDHYKKTIDPEKSTLLVQLGGLMFFIIFFIIIFILYITHIPVVGCFWFNIGYLACAQIFHPEIRKICRRIVITREKLILLVKSLKNRGKEKTKTRRHFKLPFYLREYAEEEVPAELMPSDEETDGEHSSDGFEDLTIRIKGREASRNKTITHENTKVLLQLLATTENELEQKRLTADGHPDAHLDHDHDDHHEDHHPIQTNQRHHHFASL